MKLEPPVLVHAPFTFHSHVNDAVADWRIQHERALRAYNNNRGLAEPTGDKGLSLVLRSFMNNCQVSFKGWVTEEVAAFVIIAYPRELLMEVCEHGMYSAFLDGIHVDWKPTFLDWAHLLWLVCGNACELFADLLYLLPASQKTDKGTMGRVLFCDMIEKGIFSEVTCRSIIAVFLKYPMEGTFARFHEKEMDDLSKFLSPFGIGLVFRSLLLHRARDERCDCGYMRGEEDCTCHAKYIRNHYSGPSGLQLDDDLQKEYACVLMKLICERHDAMVIDVEMRWTKQHRDEFLVSACEYIFSQQAYTELFQNLSKGEKPTLQQKNCRALSGDEITANSVRSRDRDFSHTMAQHGGCVQSNCKQMMKTGCVNVCCKQHCQKIGTRSCKVHRMYEPKEEPNYLQRKKILAVPWFHQRNVEPMKREGDI